MKICLAQCHPKLGNFYILLSEGHHLLTFLLSRGPPGKPLVVTGAFFLKYIKYYLLLK